MSAKIGWGKENRPVGFEKWKKQLDYVFAHDFRDCSAVECGYLDVIHRRLVKRERLNSNQDTLLTKVFRRMGGTL